MIIFRKISWKNFLSTGNTPTIIDLDNTSTTILLGESGSGKSTLLDAISFALFNKPFRDINKNNIVNSINQKDCLVEIEFDIGEKKFLIKRGIKPNLFEIYINGILINIDSSTKDYQKYLEKQILKFNYRSFNQIIMLGASNFTPFMLLKPIDRHQIIEELLDIQIFSVMNFLLKQRMSILKTEVQENDNSILLLQEKIKVHQKYIAGLESDNKNKIEDNENKIASNHQQIMKIEDNIIEFKNKIIEYQELISFETEVNNKMKELLDLESKLEDRSRKEKKDILFYQKNDECPTCKQHIEPEFKNNEIISKNKLLEEIESGMLQIEDKMNVLNEKKSKADDIKKKISDCEIEINKRKSSIMAIKTYIHKLEREITELKQPENKVAEEILILDLYEKEIKELQNKKEFLIKQRDVQDLANSLLKDDGVKTRIVKQYLPLINKYTNKYLNDMSFFVTFNMNEKFEEMIKARGRDDFQYGNFSDGEKQRLDLALLFTWCEIAKIKNSVNTNLLILDEIADSYLDLESTENILNLLTSNVFKGMNIILISHKNTISDKFDRALRFKKEKNFSRIIS